MKRNLSRRDFLKYIGAIAGAGALSACAPRAVRTPPSTTAPSLGPPAGATVPNLGPPICATPTSVPIPPPTPVSTSFDVMAGYVQGRGITNEGDPRPGFGYATVVPLYGQRVDPITMTIDIKWARENGVGTFAMPSGQPDSAWERRIEEWFLPASEPPFEMSYTLMFNPGIEETYETLETQVTRWSRDFLSRQVRLPSFKRLSDGRPVVIYFVAQATAYVLGLDKLERSIALMRQYAGQDIFLIGDVMADPYQVRDDPKYTTSYIRRSVTAFDAISNYYMMRAGYAWHNPQEFNYSVSPFKDMIAGYKDAWEFWGERAGKYGAKFVPPTMPTGFSNRLLWEAGLDRELIDRHEGVSYDSAREMLESASKYADPDLRMIMVAAWSEWNEGAAIVPSVGYRFNPVHAVRDTVAIQPSIGWPEDYYPTT